MTGARPRGDKSRYTDKRKRRAGHIAQSYEKRGVPEQEAERRAWASVNKNSGGGNLGGSGRGHAEAHACARKGGTSGGEASARRTPEEGSASARKASDTRRRHREEAS